MTDAVTTLVRDVNEGRTKLSFEGSQGFLRSLLEKLEGGLTLCFARSVGRLS